MTAENKALWEKRSSRTLSDFLRARPRSLARQKEGITLPPSPPLLCISSNNLMTYRKEMGLNIRPSSY